MLDPALFMMYGYDIMIAFSLIMQSQNSTSVLTSLSFTEDQWFCSEEASDKEIKTKCLQCLSDLILCFTQNFLRHFVIK